MCEGVGGCLSWIDQQLLGCFLFDAWIVNELQKMMWPQAWSDRCPARAATLTFHLLKTTEIQKQQQKTCRILHIKEVCLLWNKLKSIIK